MAYGSTFVDTITSSGNLTVTGNVAVSGNLSVQKMSIGSTNIQPVYCVQANMSTAASTTTAGWQKVPIDNLVSDVPGWWNNTTKRITPTVPGFYLVLGRARVTAVGIASLAVGLNGTQVIAIGADTGSTVLALGGSTTLYLNGSTDYVELFTYATAVKTYNNNGFDTYFQVIGPFGN